MFGNVALKLLLMCKKTLAIPVSFVFNEGGFVSGQMTAKPIRLKFIPKAQACDTPTLSKLEPKVKRGKEMLPNEPGKVISDEL